MQCILHIKGSGLFNKYNILIFKIIIIFDMEFFFSMKRLQISPRTLVVFRELARSLRMVIFP